LISPPELNILTYRICPLNIQKQIMTASQKERNELNETLNYINQNIQRCQREAGHSFVSRTTLHLKRLFNRDIVVFRCVLMNPMTDKKILNDILDEQEEIFNYHFKDILFNCGVCRPRS
jgi:glutamate decarboxylase